MYEKKVSSTSTSTHTSTRQNVLPPVPLTSAAAAAAQSPTELSRRSRTMSQVVPLTPISSSGARQVDTPIAARTSKSNREGLGALQRNLESFFHALSQLNGKLVSREDAFELKELLAAMPGPDKAEHAAAIDHVKGVIAQQDDPQLAGLLTSVCALRRQNKQCDEQLQAIEDCLREALLSSACVSAAGELESLGALADSGTDEAPTALGMRLLGLPDEVLLAAASSNDNPLLLSAAHEHVDHMYAESVRNLDSAYKKVAAAAAAGRPPADLGELTSLLQDTVSALLDHERFSAIHALPTDKRAAAARMLLDGLLRGPLERVELPLHLATPEQQRAICTALSMLEPMGTRQPHEHFEAAYLKQCLTRVHDGRPSYALAMLKEAQATRAQAAGPQQGGPQSSCPAHLFTRMPRENLVAWVKALDAKPHQALMTALDEVGNQVFAGQRLGRGIAACHRDLQDLRNALDKALGTRAPKNTVKFSDAIRNSDVRDALEGAFPLQIEGSTREVEVFARSGPVRARAQAVFDEALQRDLNQAAGAVKKVASKADTEKSDLRIAPGFAQALARIPCRVVSAVGAAAETVSVTGLSPDQAVAAIQMHTGATAAQMATLSRIYDADARIDSTMFSPGSTLQFDSNLTVFPLLGDGGQRASEVLVKPDASGSLKLRFVTTLSGIASVMPIVEGQLLQPRAVAQSAGSAKFTHDIELAPNGTCRKARLLREHDLPTASRAHNPGLQRRVIDKDLVANPDSLRALGQIVDRKLGTGFTEYLDMVDVLLNMPQDNATNVLTTAGGIQAAFLNDGQRFNRLSISVGARARIASAMDFRGSGTAGAVDRVVDAFKATQLEVAQNVLDHAKAMLAANSVAKA
ncbi:MAG: hypothetical protein H7332_16255 [Bdellovibrionales bacterium]|nr:hypothetical protein [Ramlibacter sp.]